MSVRFDPSVACQIDVTLLEADRVLSVLVQSVALQIRLPSFDGDDLAADVRALVRTATCATLPEHSQPTHDDLEIAITSRVEQNRSWFELPKRLDKVLSQLPKPIEVTLDTEFAYPSTCAALLDAFKVLNHPRLTFVLNGTAQDFVHAAGLGYGNLDKAKHNAARLGIY